MRRNITIIKLFKKKKQIKNVMFLSSENYKKIKNEYIKLINWLNVSIKIIFANFVILEHMQNISSKYCSIVIKN